MKKVIKDIFRKMGLEITRYAPPGNHEGSCVALKTEHGHKGKALLSFLVEPFLLKDGQKVSNTHTHHWECLQIGKTLLELGYDVDVIDYHAKVLFKPEKNYSCFIGVRTNFERIAQRLNEDCIKVVHLDTAHWLFNNSASYRRALELQQRRGVTVTELKRIVEPNLAIEHADYATLLGNGFTAGTYQYAQKPLFNIPVSTCATYSWAEDKGFEACRRNYLWFGGNGLVHKGLDLALEAFAEMPDYHLYICGPIEDEKDFETAYYKELYQTPNIHTLGWMDVSSDAFSGITSKCIGLVYPSSSEGQSGAVINCLHAGLIPVLSYESGVDVDDFGVILGDCSIETIKEAVQTVSGLPAEKLRGMSRRAWEFAREHHSRERFSEDFGRVIRLILEQNGRQINIPGKMQAHTFLHDCTIA